MSKLYLNVPHGVRVERHHTGGENQEIRFVTPVTKRFSRLLAIAKHGKFSWIIGRYRELNLTS